jgi:hypothetical protein
MKNRLFASESYSLQVGTINVSVTIQFDSKLEVIDFSWDCDNKFTLPNKEINKIESEIIKNLDDWTQEAKEKVHNLNIQRKQLIYSLS